MINSISVWAKSIILAVIIATIIEMILPNNNNRKYIKTIIGVYILFVIISPIIKKFSNNSIAVDASEYKNFFNTEIESSYDTNTINTRLNSTYITSIKSDINNRLKEKGYKVDSLNVDVELVNEEKYGTIKSITLSVSKIKDENSIVDKVIINISNENTESKSNLSQNNKNEIKELLSETYGIDKNNIVIE